MEAKSSDLAGFGHLSLAKNLDGASIPESVVIDSFYVVQLHTKSIASATGIDFELFSKRRSILTAII